MNRYVKGKGKGRSDTNGLKSAYDVLYSFNRWPTWMWANREIVSFIEWLRHYNDNERQSNEEKVGFYGLDVYSLWESLEVVIKYLKRVDPSAVKKAVEAFQCFEPYAMSVEDYARAALFVPEFCEDEVIGMLIELRSKASQYQADGIDKREEYFNAEQNAIVAKNAELYYRKMIQGGTATWNIRDTHMMDTLKRLMRFHGIDRSKCIVWAHNTHVGDARQTDMADAKMINIGQLVREYANDNKNKVWLVGFGTYRGTVIAAREWGEKMEIMQVPPAVEGSWDSIIHQQINDNSNRLFIFKNDVTPIDRLVTKSTKRENSETRARTRTEKGPGQRAIGVI